MPQPTPCHRCPKYLLYPGNPFQPGLDPRNSLAVDIYRLASQDVRAGDAAILISTIDMAKAIAVMDEYDLHLPTWLHRQQTLRLIKIMDEVALEVRGPIEEAARDAAIKKARQQAEAERQKRR